MADSGKMIDYVMTGSLTFRLNSQKINATGDSSKTRL